MSKINLIGIEFEVEKGTGIREGTAGKMYDTVNENTYQGNVKQVNFAEKSPFSNTKLFKIDPNIKEIK